MAIRFLDTKFYKSSYVRGLPANLKSLYLFIILDCDGSGIWDSDLEAASLYTGFPITEEQFQKEFVDKGKAIPVIRGKFFFPDFIEHQYPKGLSNNNPAHKNHILALKKFSLIDDNLAVIKKTSKDTLKTLQRPSEDTNKGLSSSISNSNSKGNSNSNGQSNGNCDLGKSENPLFHSKTLTGQMIELWLGTFPSYTKDPERDLPALRSIADFVFQQAGCPNSYGDTEKEISCLNTFQLIADQVNREPFWINKPLKSISSHIQEFYNKIKNPVENGSGKNGTNGTKYNEASLAQKIHKRAGS